MKYGSTGLVYLNIKGPTQGVGQIPPTSLGKCSGAARTDTIPRQLRRWLIAFCLVTSLLAVSLSAEAVTILTGPAFTPSTTAPLAGLLQLTTDVSSQLSIQVTDGTNIWLRDFYTFATNQSVPLLGFKPGRTNSIQVTVYDTQQNAYTAAQPLRFVTPALPANFPVSTLLTNNPGLMEPGYTLFIVMNRNTGVGYITIMDYNGQVVWYNTLIPYAVDVSQLPNGDLFLPVNLNPFEEMNMLGQVVKTWNAPSGYPIDLHDAVMTDHGTILYLADVDVTVTNFPSNTTNANAALETVKVIDTPAVEISVTNSALLHVWSPLNMLDPTRVTYLTTYGSLVDNEHGNAVLEDTNDNSIIISLRNQNTVFKFDRSGQVKWILGPPANWPANLQPYLLTPEGTPFEWNYGQHAPMLTPQGTLVLYDDGNFRASPFDPPVLDQNNYSRGVEFNIDEDNMQVSQVWDTTPANEDRLYTGALGRAAWLPQTGNVLVTYGLVSYINGVPPSSHATNATMSRIIEYTHDPVPQVVFDLRFFDPTNTSTTYKGYFLYRSYRIPDLYAHPANPVVNLSVTIVDNVPYLQFTADPVHSYEVETSTDLVNWQTAGPADQTDTPGQYEFYDSDEIPSDTRFYRVVTE